MLEGCNLPRKLLEEPLFLAYLGSCSLHTWWSWSPIWLCTSDLGLWGHICWWQLYPRGYAQNPLWARADYGYKLSQKTYLCPVGYFILACGGCHFAEAAISSRHRSRLFMVITLCLEWHPARISTTFWSFMDLHISTEPADTQQKSLHCFRSGTSVLSPS